MNCKEQLEANTKHRDDGCLVTAIVHPGSRKQDITVEDGVVSIRVSSPPIEGRANEEIVKLFKKKLKVKVSIVSGHRSKRKTLFFHNTGCSEIVEKLCRG